MNSTSILSEKLAVPVGARDHIQRALRAPLTLLEYGDFECPACGRAHPVVKWVQQGLGDHLRLVFRHFPLANIHPDAEHAAEAAEAAGAQGRFWEMHDVLFENQDALEDDDLVLYAQMLGLDADRLVSEVETGAYIGRVRDDFKSGIRSGVNGTPTFFINGRRYDGPLDPGTFIGVLNEVLAGRRE